MVKNRLKLEKVIKQEIFPAAQSLQAQVGNLFSTQIGAIGPQGLTGTDKNGELDWAVQYLDGALNLLLQMADELGVDITRFNQLSLKYEYVSLDGKIWTRAETGQLEDGTLWKFTNRDGVVLPIYKEYLCLYCGKSKSEHNSVSRACPVGRKHRVMGHMTYHNVYSFKPDPSRPVKLKQGQFTI